MTFKNFAYQSFHESEIYFHLYVHEIDGPNPNEKVVVPSTDHHRFGAIGVADWAICDGPDANATLVARAHGMYCFANSAHSGGCYNHYAIVFEDPCHKGSTLHVMAHSISGGLAGEDQGAIVGGTGEFAMARGIVSKKRIEVKNNLRIFEMKIHATYVPMNKNGNAWKFH